MKKEWNFFGGLVGVIILAVTAQAATQGNVTLEARSTVVNSITLSSVASPVVANLETAQTDVKFADITIASNDSDGFDIELQSKGKTTDGGKMVLLKSDSSYVDTPGTNQEIAYTLKAVAASGTLGTGVAAATNLGTALDLGTGKKTLSFPADQASSATTGYKLDLKFSTTAKPALMGGLFKEVVEVTIVERS